MSSRKDLPGVTKEDPSPKDPVPGQDDMEIASPGLLAMIVSFYCRLLTAACLLFTTFAPLY